MDPETYQLNDIRELNTRREGWWDFIPRSANDPTVPSYQWRDAPTRIPKPILTEERRLEKKVQDAESRGLNLGNLPGMSKTQKQATAGALGKLGSAAVLGAMGYPNLAAQQAWSGVTGWVEAQFRDQAEKRLGLQRVSMPLSVSIQNEADPYDYDRLRIGKKRDKISKNPTVKHRYWKYHLLHVDENDLGEVASWDGSGYVGNLTTNQISQGPHEDQFTGDFIDVHKIRLNIEIYSRKVGDTWPAADTAVRAMLWYVHKPTDFGEDGSIGYTMFGPDTPIDTNRALLQERSVFTDVIQRRESQYLIIGDWKLNWKGNAGPTSTVFEFEKEFPAPLRTIPTLPTAVTPYWTWGGWNFEMAAEYLNQNPDGPYLQYDIHWHTWFTDSHSRKKHKRD